MHTHGNCNKLRRLILGSIALSMLTVAVETRAADFRPVLPTPKAAQVAQAAPSFDAKAYFQGNTVQLVLGFRAGGGTDALARYIAVHWPKYIPGEPRIRVSNITPSPADTNFMAAAEPNGLVINLLAHSQIINQYMKVANFKVKDFEFIGGYAGGGNAVMITDALPYKDIRDAKDGSHKLISATAATVPGQISASDLGLILMAEWFNLPLELKAVSGGTSVANTLLMFERGEVNVTASANQWPIMPALRPGWVKSGKVKLFVKWNHPEVPFAGNSEEPMDRATAPNIHDLLTPEQENIWRAVVGPRLVYDKALITTPRTPKSLVEAYRTAWDAALRDEKFVKGFLKAGTGGLEVQFLTGAQVEKRELSLDALYAKNREAITKLGNKLALKYFK